MTDPTHGSGPDATGPSHPGRTWTRTTSSTGDRRTSDERSSTGTHPTGTRSTGTRTATTRRRAPGTGSPVPAHLPGLHVGHGRTRGALTVFPVWTEAAIPALDYVTALPRDGRVDELPTGPQVNSLVISNPGPLPLLLIEGSLLEAGWQHRVLLRDTLVGHDSEFIAEVACVERGRWQGGAGQELGEETAPVRVRAALREEHLDQGRVWAEVDGYQSRLARTPTASLVETVRRRRVDLDQLVGDLPVLPGQRGAIIGIGGQPVVLDLVDHPDTFASRWPALLRSAALDALDAPAEPTPGRRARRFAQVIGALPVVATGTSGIGTTLASPTDAQIQLRGLAAGRVVHATCLNLRHPIAARA